MDEHKENQPEDLEGAEATVLPAREAMSIIAPDTSPYVPDLEPVSETTPDGTGSSLLSSA